MRLSVSMMQAFPCSYFLGDDNEQFQAWHNSMSGKKDCGTSNTSNSLVKIGSADCQRWTDGGKKGTKK